MGKDLEARAGLDDLSALHAKRDALVKTASNLYARFGPFGTAEARRKSALALAAMQVRADATERLTEKAIEDASRTHKTYLACLDEMEDGRATWLVLENKIQNITDVIQRGPALARFAAAEVGLRQGGA